MNKNDLPNASYARILVRIAMAVVFIWFGLNQLLDSSSWLGWLPSWALSLPFSPLLMIAMNGFIETVLGTVLLLGYFTRISSLILSLHLLFIAFSVGYNDIAVRDLGLALATFSTFLQGPDNWCLETRRKKKS